MRQVHDEFEYVPAKVWEQIAMRQTLVDQYPDVTQLAQRAGINKRMPTFARSYRELLATNMGQLFDRALFAICTQNTGTKLALKQYEYVASVPWTTEKELQRAMADGGAGLGPAKGSTVWAIYTAMRDGQKLLGHPIRDMRITGHPSDSIELWHAARDRLDAIPGIGLKLASLILHLSCPFECKLLVLDTWFAKQGWYDVNPAKRAAYLHAERHWLALCELNGWAHPSIAREILWSTIGQNRVFDVDDNWWTYVLRLEQTSPLIRAFRGMPVTPYHPSM